MIHPDTELRKISDTVGYGVFATRFIARGTLTYVKDPLEIELDRADWSSLREPVRSLADKYAYVDQRGTRIVSWDLAKFVNHCCFPNTISTGWGFEIAVGDIQAGDEITDEYALFNLQAEMPVSCTSPDCRGVVCPDDLERHARRWDGLIKNALLQYPRVQQPLAALLDAETLNSLQAYMDTGRGYRSVLRLKADLEPVALAAESC